MDPRVRKDDKSWRNFIEFKSTSSADSQEYFSSEKFPDHTSSKSIFLLKNLLDIPQLDSFRSCVRVPTRTHAFARSVFALGSRIIFC